ncbi:putative serine incorporator isoform X1 [Gossypium australe]|uniref:Putative serine incorporator isoform X1 n=1 Tax=Gossypium australe TaxID=47621 RepID=A0A5B6UMS1_9ROSI|nr:putative serine incorporator isoform X1 [Gossypium australe]
MKCMICEMKQYSSVGVRFEGKFFKPFAVLKTGVGSTGENCIRKAEASNRTDWLTIISFIVALLAMVIATFSTGIDSQCFQVKKEAPAEDAVPYGYGFFHFVFATGAMYFAMLLIGWNTHHIIKKYVLHLKNHLVDNRTGCDMMDDRCRLDKYLGEDSERMASRLCLLVDVGGSCHIVEVQTNK